MKADAGSISKPLGVSWWIWLLGIFVVGGIALAAKMSGSSEEMPSAETFHGQAIKSPVKGDADTKKLREIIATCSSTGPVLKAGILVETLAEFRVKDTRSELERTFLPGKAMILDRDLAKNEADLSTSRARNQSSIKSAHQAFEDGDKLVRERELDPRLEEEYLAWQMHCQNSIDLLLAWQRDLRAARHQMDLSMIRGLPYEEAAKPYREVMDRKFPELTEAPRF